MNFGLKKIKENQETVVYKIGIITLSNPAEHIDQKEAAIYDQKTGKFVINKLTHDAHFLPSETNALFLKKPRIYLAK